MLRYLLDTNIVIFVIRQRPRGLLDVFRVQDGRMAISSITLGELVHGAEKSVDPPRNHRLIEEFTSRLEVLPYGDLAASHYGQIRARLEKEGRIIGVNDLHIAAHARSAGLTLVTNNRSEFDRVEGLVVEDWTAA